MITHLCLQIKLEYYKLKDQNYQAIFKSEYIDWCLLMSKNLKGYFFVKMTLEGFKMIAPQFFHKCPYSGVHSATNISLSRPIISLYPTGTFKLKVSITNGSDEMLKIDHVYEMK